MPQAPKRITCDTAGLNPQLQYVCWLDLMGAQSIMRRSMRQATSAVMKIHIACQEELAAGTDVIVHPVIDGVYMRSLRRVSLEGVLRKVMWRLAEEFISETNNMHRCLYRGGIAFGPLVAGTELAPAARVLETTSYIQGIAIGMPLTQAYSEERAAPPYGIAVHESARAFSPSGEKPFPGMWWAWWKRKSAIQYKLWHALNAYYDWAKVYPKLLTYQPDRMAAHLEMAKEYFSRKDTPMPNQLGADA